MVLDREILALHHFERLTNAEVAETLEMNESTTSSRYLRALRRLRDELSQSRACWMGRTSAAAFASSTGRDLYGNAIPRARDRRAVGGRIRRAVPARGATVPERVRLRGTRARRGDPRAVPCALVMEQIAPESEGAGSSSAFDLLRTIR